jgi:peptide methionine sulfoxide reductase MsrA
MRKLPSKTSTRAGYSGGDVPNASYHHHGTHAEALEVVFHPACLSFRDLLALFFQIHDQGLQRAGPGVPTEKAFAAAACGAAK